MLNRINEFQHSLCRLGDFFRVRAVRLAGFVLLYAVLAGPFIVGECFAQSASSVPSNTLAKSVNVVRADSEPAQPAPVDIKQQLGAKAVGDLNKSLPLVSPNGKVVGGEHEDKPGSGSNESSYSVYVLGIHALFLLAGVFYAGVVFYAFSVAGDRREDFRCLMEATKLNHEFRDNVDAMVWELRKLKNKPCNDVVFEYMYRRRGFAAKETPSA